MRKRWQPVKAWKKDLPSWRKNQGKKIQMWEWGWWFEEHEEGQCAWSTVSEGGRQQVSDKFWEVSRGQITWALDELIVHQDVDSYFLLDLFRTIQYSFQKKFLEEPAWVRGWAFKGSACCGTPWAGNIRHGASPPLPRFHPLGNNGLAQHPEITQA